jgi:hypothetical protein
MSDEFSNPVAPDFANPLPPPKQAKTPALNNDDFRKVRVHK